MSQQKLGKFGDIYKVILYKIRQRFNNGADIRMQVERRRLLCLCHSISLGGPALVLATREAIDVQQGEVPFFQQIVMGAFS